MKRIINLTIMLVVILICLTGCSTYLTNEEYIENDKLSGTIIGKYHIPSGNKIENMSIHGNLVDGVEVDRAEQWVIRIERKRASHSTDTEYTDINVNVEEWNELKIGDRFSK